MGNIARLLFVLSIVVAPALVWATSAPLPQRVATHFGRGGVANGWMTHDGYVMFMLLLTTVLPLVVVALAGLVPRSAASGISRRRRDYWLSPQRRETTFAWLASHACALGVLLVAFMLGVHFLTLEANARTPARLDEPAFFALLAGFIALLTIWIVAMKRRFA